MLPGHNRIVLCLILDSRQNPARRTGTEGNIVLCLILDSRQNCRPGSVRDAPIVLCLILDSRQNYRCRVCGRCRLYCALFWIQGKTAPMKWILNYILYCALFWIQGKTGLFHLRISCDCTVPYFGFKAKLPLTA